MREFPARAAALVDKLADLADPALRPELGDLAAALRAEPDTGAAGRLADATGLTPFEYDLLLLAGLPEEHEALSRLARRRHGGAEPWFTPATAALVLDLDAAGRGHLRRALESGPLRRHRLVTGPDAVPLPERGFRLPPGLWSVLRGIETWPDTLHPVSLPALTGALVPELAAALEGGARVVAADRGGRATASWPRSRWRTVPGAVVVPAAELDGERTPVWTVHLLARGAVPVVEGSPARPPLPAHEGAVVVAAAAATGLVLDDRPGGDGRAAPPRPRRRGRAVGTACCPTSTAPRPSWPGCCGWGGSAPPGRSATPGPSAP